MPPVLIGLLFNRYVLFAALMAVIVFVIYEKGRADVEAKVREAALKSEVAALQRDRDIAKAAEADAAQRAQALAEEAAQRDKEIAVYAEELKARPDRCDLTPADLNRLRGPAGKAKAR
jgi:hypothetical protein